ncbi:tripartite tricarboxylate transporter permease [Chloroflexota bacterium]
MFELFIQGLLQLLTPMGLLLLIAGVTYGLVIGILPGIGGLFAMAMLLPFIYGLKPEIALPLLLFVSAPSVTGGSITAILLNMPGDTINTATLLDGFPMTKKGEGGRALGAALTSSGLGGITGVFMALAVIPLLIVLVRVMGKPEQWALVLVGLAFVGILGGRSVLKGCIGGLLGLFISLIGYQATTGMARFTFDTAFLYDGLGLTPVLFGIFVLPEVIEMAQRGSITGLTEIPKEIMKDIIKGIKDVFRHFWLFIRSSTIGFLIGAIPGVGAMTSIFIAYGQAVKTSKHPERFGTGIVEGVIAPESANNATLGGALLPTLGFGIPGNAPLTLVLAGFIIVGLWPGPTMLIDHLDLCFSLLWACALANLVGAVICLVFMRHAVKIAYVSTNYLVPITALLVVVGAFAYHEYILDLVVLMVAGGLGYFMKRFGYSRVALVLGFILGFMFEMNLFISLDCYGPAFLLRPIVLVLLAVVIYIVAGDQIKVGAVKLVKLVRGQQRHNNPALPYGEPPSSHQQAGGRPTEFSIKGNTYFLMVILLLAIVTICLSLQITSFKAQLLPLIISIALAILAVAGLSAELKRKVAKEKETKAVAIKVDLITAAWLLGFGLLIFLVGIPLAAFLFIAAYLKLHNNGWLRSVAFGLGLGIFTYVVFEFLFRVDLYRGVLDIPFYRFLP